MFLIHKLWGRVLLTAIFATIICFPSLLQPDHIIGLDEPMGDRANTLWLHLYWFQNHNFQTTDILFPVGVDLKKQYFNWLDIWLAEPWIGILGWPTYYTPMVWGIACFNIWTGTLWASSFCRNRALSFLGGMIFASSVAFISPVWNGRLIQTMIGVVPLSFWAVWKLHQKPSWWGAILAGVLVGITGTVYLYFGLGIAIVSGVLSLLSLSQWRNSMQFLLFYGIAALFAQQTLSGMESAYFSGASQTQSFPSIQEAFSPLYSGTVGATIDHSLQLSSFGWRQMSLPLFFVPLLILGWTKKQWLWTIIVCFFGILLLGPLIQLDDMMWKNAPYIWMYENIPTVARMHWPSRWLSFFLCASMPYVMRSLSLLGTKSLLFLPLLFIDSAIKEQWPIPSTSFSVPSCYISLREQPKAAVLHTPFVYSSRAIVYQPIHQKPIANPFSMSYEPSRWTPNYQEKIVMTPFLRWLEPMDNPSFQPKELPSDAIQSIKNAGVGYVVHQFSFLKDALDSPKVAEDHGEAEKKVRRTLIHYLGKPNCLDEDVAIWKLE